MTTLRASGLLGRVETAIRRAANATGVDFGYLFKQAETESGLDPNAKARTSSASGLYQFIDSTWLATVAKHGAEHGLGWAQNLIERAGGRFTVRDPAARAAVMALKRDPEAASLMAAAHAADNASNLAARLGRSANGVDLYMAHFLGAGGAARFLSRMAVDGAAAAADLFPKAAAANRPVFFRRDGSPRSLSEIYDRFAAKLGGTPALIDARQSRPIESASPAAPPADAKEYARAAYRLLAELGA